MTLQREIVEKYDQESGQIVESEPAGSGWIVTVARLLIAPPVAFMGVYFFRGGIVRGMPGLVEAGNAWGRSVIIEAKRYEKQFCSDEAKDALLMLEGVDLDRPARMPVESLDKK